MMLLLYFVFKGMEILVSTDKQIQGINIMLYIIVTSLVCYLHTYIILFIYIYIYI